MSTYSQGRPAPCALALDKIDFILRVEPLAAGVDQIEPLLEDLLQYIVRHEECRDVLEVRFEELLDALPHGAIEVLQYTMHTLRWNSVEVYARGCLERERDVTRRRILESVVEAFSDNWSDRDLYERYEG
jgi:hypothetical protein